MNTAALKSFAPAVRTQLMEAVTRKLDFALSAKTPDYLTTYAPQVDALRQLEKLDRKGLIERVAYTWFNRLAALRFMDARGWHPFRARVLTAASAAETQPEILKLTRTGALPEELHPHTNPQRLNDLLDGKIPSPDAQGEVYRHLVLAACHFYHALLPNIFEKLDDETELLLPDDLLTEHSIVHGFRTEISDADCVEKDDQGKERANVEILGWLYQFYISEKKDQVMARKSAVPTEDIPAVTQLFTPHWIVRYLVENSLGRLWLLNHPQSKLRDHMPYYIEDSAAPGNAAPLEKVWKHPDDSTRRVFPPRDASFFRVFDGEFERLPGDATIQEIWLLALSIDGYALCTKRGWGECRDLYQRKKELYRQNGKWEGTTEELWCVLFFYQRDWRWAEWPLDFPELPMVQALYAELRQRLIASRAGSSRTPRVPPALPQNEDFLRVSRPEEIRLLDPASGSGHMLTYAFDLLVLIYEEEGYAPSDIPGLILRHNLCGLEICPRAAQLAELALVFKAREKSRRFFQPEHLVRPNIIELREVRFAEGELSAYFKALGVQPSAIHPELNRLLHQFEEAKNFGSLIQPCLTETEIQSARSAISHLPSANTDLMVGAIHAKVLRVLDQAEALTQRYQVVLANPPYMGSKAMNKSLKDFTANEYTVAKNDLMTCFMARSQTLAKPHGLLAMINLPSWMFLGTFEKFRIRLLGEITIANLLHLGRGIFGADFGTVAFAFVNAEAKNSTGEYRRLFTKSSLVDSPETKAELFLQGFGKHKFNQAEFSKIPGSPIAYWLPEQAVDAYDSGESLGDGCYGQPGLQTSDNATFVRQWFEVSLDSVGFGCSNNEMAASSGRRWFPYLKGGEFRKWYGNQNEVVDWEDNGRRIKDYVNTTYPYLNGNIDYVVKDRGYYFKKMISYTKVTIADFGARASDSGFVFDVAGSAIFPSEAEFELVLGFMCSTLASYFARAQNPTLNIQSGDIARLPFRRKLLSKFSDNIANIAKEAMGCSRADWDNFETSWDFRDQPLLRPGLKGATLAASWQTWEAHCQAAIRRMQELETENNRLFITAYGLQDELKPEVPEDQITLARPDVRKDMAAFLSYAVGCMMGRYSLDQPGLILANAGDTVKEYLAKVNCPLEKLTFTPDEDGIIPVLDGEWFEDDIVARTRDFLRATFGEATLRENLRFIEDSLGKELRKYFLNDFYKDHLQTYKKRPIYWLVQSPRKGFSVLIYLHRYTKDTMNLVLNRYLRDYQVKLRNRLTHATELQVTAATAKAKTEARKEADKLTKILTECEEWERQTMLPLAQARIELDLDDGVKTNYLKLGEALAPIAGLAAKEDE